jgi:uncharacterized protein YbjT (DUF2867 family)
VYELTGPRLLSFAEIATALSAATGRTITYLPVTPEEYVASATAAGVPSQDAEMLAALFADICDGHNSSLARGVTDVLHRPPRDFDEYALAAASGVWTGVAPGASGR